MTDAERAKLAALLGAGKIAYVENWLSNGDIRTHVADAAGRPLCGARHACIHGPLERPDNKGCWRCWRMRPEAFPGEFTDGLGRATNPKRQR